MRRTFYIVGPTATGKSELAADVAQELGAEIVSADAFQIYGGLDLLSAKPSLAVLAQVPHHLIGTQSNQEQMSAEKFRAAAVAAISEIHSRGKMAVVVGGTGLYIKALTHGLAKLPEIDPRLREKLNASSMNELRAQLIGLDPDAAHTIDMKNRRRVARALEICLLTGKPVSSQRTQWKSVAGIVDPGPRSTITAANGVFVFRERDDLYQRINSRVTAMFESGVTEEVRTAGTIGETASKMIGLREIRELLDGKMSIPQCVAAIQQSTRRYAKRQLTWFRRQPSFEPLNLSPLTHKQAVKWITHRARRAVQGND
ncbi:MAG: tRNA (adenosine(37)-N6)-dimethylallyltransferase MiaA [Verrucomicrobiota bacterium]